MAPPPLPEKISHPASATAESEPEPIPEDFDIFADAGDYEGIDLGDDDDDDKGPIQAPGSPKEPSMIPRKRWFETDEDQRPQPDTSKTAESKAHSPPPPTSDEEDSEQPTRLVPLQTSAIPSIRDLLAMDGAQDKRKKRKDKKKGGKDVNPEEKKKVTAEAKVDRDYKRSAFILLAQGVRCDFLVCAD
jgi:IK cytokine